MGGRLRKEQYVRDLSGLIWRPDLAAFPGMLVEVFGETDTGKTALALHFALSIQNSGGKSVYLDMEGKFQDSFARLLGLKDDAFSICENQGAEEIFEICELLALGGSVDLVILDSLTALLTGEEYDLLYKDAVSPVELPESAAGVDIEDYPVFSEEVDSVNKAGNTGRRGCCRNRVFSGCLSGD